MSKREKTVIFLIIIALSITFILSFLPNNVGTRAVAAETASPLAYTYMMSAPAAVAADGDTLYALDQNGNIVNVTDGMKIAGKRAGATRLAAGNGRTATNTEADSIAVFCGNYAAEMTPDALLLGDGENKTVIARPQEGHTFASGAMLGNEIYAAVKNGDKYSLFAYDLANDNAKTLIKNEIKADGEIIAMTAVSADEIYYATPYSLYTVGKSRGEHVGGIISLANDGENLYYASRSGEICLYDGERSITILSASEKVSVATRKNFAVFTDEGNNKLTLIKSGATLTADIERPVAAAIDYAGNVYAASENKVKIFTRSLEYVGGESDMSFGGADDHISEIKIDPSDVTGCTLYALSESGMLRRSTDDSTASGIARVEISADGEVYAMKTDGRIVRFSGDLTEENEVLAGGDYVDFALDQGGHVYRATTDAIFRDGDASPVFESSGITEIAVSLITLPDSGKAVAYGDLVVIGKDDCASIVIPRATAGTDMRDDEQDAEYTAFLEAANSAAPNAADYAIEIRKAETASDVYVFPAETPVDGNSEVGVGANLIMIARYRESAYYYAIAETAKGSVKGFVNINTLSAPLPYDAAYDSDVCAPIKTASVYKYPSQIAPVVGETALGNSYKLLPFSGAYRDAAGREWCRISFKDAGGEHDGYVLRTNVSINGQTGGYNKDMYTDAVIKADTETVATYIDADGKYELGTIADGTPVKLEETFNKSREFTKITYVSNTDTGATTTCYVRTENIKHTEAGWYQVIFFIVGSVVIVAIAVIIVIVVRKKRRID